MLQLIGRFHPVLVHLPIGVLLVGCLFQLLAAREKFKTLAAGVPLLFLLGALGAVAACVSGYVLSRGDDYDAELLGKHQWMGIAVAVVSTAAWWLQRQGTGSGVKRASSLVLILLIAVTGHLGGTITHGQNYLSLSNDDDADSLQARKPIVNVQEAFGYADVVQPILQQKCYGCHGPTKQKGSLRMDDVALFTNGGKNGPAFVPNNAAGSEMIKRCLLPREDDDHMPPKEKPQLTESETALLQWWINSGAAFDKQVKSLQQPDKVKPLLTALQSRAPSVAKAESLWPDSPVEPADATVVQQLKKAGAVVLPLSKQSNYLSVSLRDADTAVNNTLALLPQLAKQVVELKLSSTGLNAANVAAIAECTAVRRLSLDNTGITNASLTALQSLQELRYLNLVGNPVTVTGLMKLKGLKNLKAIYVYRSGITHLDWRGLQKAFPKTVLDSGGYNVATLATDTVPLKFSGSK